MARPLNERSLEDKILRIFIFEELPLWESPLQEGAIIVMA